MGGFLKTCKSRLFEALGGGGVCDLRLVVGPEDDCETLHLALLPSGQRPEDAAAIDDVVSTIGASYDELLGVRASRRTSAIAVPVFRLRRADFANSPLETWLAGHGLCEEVLLFFDDAEIVLELARDKKAGGSDAVQESEGCSAAQAVQLQEVVLTREPVRSDESPGACGCRSALVAWRLLERTSALAPAGRSRLFATGPGAEDPMLLDVLRLLREGILGTTDGLDPCL